jgi:hypothetical protein
VKISEIYDSTVSTPFPAANVNGEIMTAFPDAACNP